MHIVKYTGTLWTLNGHSIRRLHIGEIIFKLGDKTIANEKKLFLTQNGIGWIYIGNLQVMNQNDII